MVIIYTTCANSKEAERLAKSILENHLGANVDYWPIETMYRWEGKIKKEKEVMMIITTFESKLQDVDNLISKNHNYSTPLIAGIDVRRINRAYKEWMMHEIG